MNVSLLAVQRVYEMVSAMCEKKGYCYADNPNLLAALSKGRGEQVSKRKLERALQFMRRENYLTFLGRGGGRRLYLTDHEFNADALAPNWAATKNERATKTVERATNAPIYPVMVGAFDGKTASKTPEFTPENGQKTAYYWSFSGSLVACEWLMSGALVARYWLTTPYSKREEYKFQVDKGFSTGEREEKKEKEECGYAAKSDQGIFGNFPAVEKKTGPGLFAQTGDQLPAGSKLRTIGNSETLESPEKPAKRPGNEKAAQPPASTEKSAPRAKEPAKTGVKAKVVKAEKVLEPWEQRLRGLKGWFFAEYAVAYKAQYGKTGPVLEGKQLGLFHQYVKWYMKTIFEINPPELLTEDKIKLFFSVQLNTFINMPKTKSLIPAIMWAYRTEAKDNNFADYNKIFVKNGFYSSTII